MTSPTIQNGKFKYTAEVVDQLKSLHAENTAPEDIALILGTTKRSIIAKLSSLGLYSKPQYVNKMGETPIKKEAYVEQLCNLLDIDYELGESLGKVNKFILKKLVETLSRRD
jgi:hypothetical protein